MHLERVVLEVFGGCNYSCKMCPQSTGRDSEFLKKMPLDLFEQILDEIVEHHGFPIINLEGSGEPTVLKDLPNYIEACSRRQLKSYIYCNGSLLNGQYMKDVVDAGLSFVRFSCIGYNRELYHAWMSQDNFNVVRQNAIDMKAYITKHQKDCTVASYHLILEPDRMQYEIDQYINNFIEPVGSQAYIWKMHNWSGNHRPIYLREKTKRRTCGRPFAPELTIRAGGIGQRHGAVTPCCQTLGPPNESISVLGHLDTQSIQEVWDGPAYKDLRRAHQDNDFDKIPYCSNCDFLYQDRDILVWSNDCNAQTDHLLGTNFSLNDFKNP